MAAVIVALSVGLDGEGRSTPNAPAGWTLVHESGGWISVWPLGRVARPGAFCHLWHITDNGTEGAYILAGPALVVRELATRAIQAWTLQGFRDDTGPRATVIKSSWQDDRPRDELGNLIDPTEPIVHLRRAVAGFLHRSDLQTTTTVPT